MDENTKKQDDYWIGFDLGGTKMLAVVFDKDFEIIGKSRKKTKGYEGMDSGLKRINSTIADAIEDAQAINTTNPGAWNRLPRTAGFQKRNDSGSAQPGLEKNPDQEIN